MRCDIIPEVYRHDVNSTKARKKSYQTADDVGKKIPVTVFAFSRSSVSLAV